MNNVTNNNIMFMNILKYFILILQYSNFYREDEEKEKEEKDKEVNKVEVIYILCLTHLLQLALKTLLNNVRINSTNNKL